MSVVISPEIAIESPELHVGQLAVAQSEARFKVLVAGRRWGKTSLGVSECFKTSVRGGRTWWVAPTYPLASIGWKVARHLGRQIPFAVPRESDRLITFPGGGEFQVKSADDPDGLRGMGLDGVVVDEAAYVKEEAWQESLRPALSDRLGWALFISTGNGLNWFHALFEYAKTHPGWASWQRPTWDNPHIDTQEIEDARGLLPDAIFRQEYGAEFIDLAGLKPFLREWIQFWGVGGAVETLPDDLTVEIGFDPAISKKDTADRSSMTVAGQARTGPSRGMIFILESEAGHWSAYEQADKIIKAVRRWKARTVRIEDVAYQRALGEILDFQSRQAGVPIHIELVRAEVDKLRRAQQWSGLVEGGVVLLGPGQADLIDCMLGVPQDARKWDPVDSAGICVSGFPLLHAAQQRLPGNELSTPKTAESYAARTRTAAKQDRFPMVIRRDGMDRARGYAVKQPHRGGRPAPRRGSPGYRSR